MRDLVVDLRRVLRQSLTVPQPAEKFPSGRPSRLRLWAAIAAAAALLAVIAGVWLRNDHAWQNPLALATFTRLTDFDGSEIDAALSPDGKLVAFLSDRDGPFDAFIGQVGVGDFVNLTKGRFLDLFHEQSRSVGFSGDGTQIWLRVSNLNPARPMPSAVNTPSRGVWTLPAVGNGAPRRFLEQALVAVWSPDGSQIAYQEASPGDPLFIADRNGANPRRVIVGRTGEHQHYQTWSLDQRYLYFVRGFRSTEMDLYRVPVSGGQPERLTHHASRVSYPVVLDDQRLLYVAPGLDGSGNWIYCLDLKRRQSHRVSLGVEQYLSIAASGGPNGPQTRLVATVANPRGSIWTVPLSLTQTAEERDARPMSLPSVRAVAPRFGPNYLLYLSSKGGGDGLWKLQDGAATELWKAADGVLASPAAVSPDGGSICFVIRRGARQHLYVATSDGAGAHELAAALDVRDAPSWSPDGKWIAFTAEEDAGGRIYKVAAAGGAPERRRNFVRPGLVARRTHDSLRGSLAGHHLSAEGHHAG